MSNRFALKAWAETLREVAFGSITDSLAPMGGSYEFPVRVYFFTNGTDETVYVSWNGTDNMFAILAGSSLTLDVTTNKSFDDGLYLGVGNSTYIAYQTVPTSGSVYLSIVYGTNGVTN